MAAFSPRALQHHRYLSLGHRKCPSSTTPGISAQLSPHVTPLTSLPLVRAHVGKVVEKIAKRGLPHVRRGRDNVYSGELEVEPSSPVSVNERVGGRSSFRRSTVVWEVDGKVQNGPGKKEGHVSRSTGYGRNKEVGSSESLSTVSTNETIDGNVKKNEDSAEANEKMGQQLKKPKAKSVVVEDKTRNKGNKSKIRSPQIELRIGLDMCSKKGDVIGAISLYDTALREGFRIQQYHYNVLLYLCSSAALGVVLPGKSGSTSSGSSNSNSLSFVDSANERISESEYEEDSKIAGANGALIPEIEHANGDDDSGILVSEDIKDYALRRGLEIYEKMRSEDIPLNEAALTSVARMAMATGNGELAFKIVKKIKYLGLTLRLRSYGPALFAFCNNGDIDKAFEVEKHMLDNGICPEEPELAALLTISIEAQKSEKVYYLLQKLRSTVRQVSPSTAQLIESWFNSPTASRIGKRKWNRQLIAQAIENGGGGWHGLGWLGRGKWIVKHANVNVHAVCQNCGERLVAIDIDPNETENFAKSVASIAQKRERNSSFQKFQRWLEYYGPFEAVIDAANVGLFSQRQFALSKVNAVVNGIRQKHPSKRWPLIIVHNRRLHGGKMDEETNRKLVEKWKNADAIYATPTGSNDDWYWLFAAVKCKSLIVTNDEMRDHNFQILGNDFFPKWKERHQVRFSFRAGSPEFSMPPACSIVIQESEKGHWHIPIFSEQEHEAERTWLCVTRPNFQEIHESSFSPKGTTSGLNKRSSCPDVRRTHQLKKTRDIVSDDFQSTAQHLKIERRLKKILKHESIMSELEIAERLSGCVVDFQI